MTCDEILKADDGRFVVCQGVRYQEHDHSSRLSTRELRTDEHVEMNPNDGTLHLTAACRGTIVVTQYGKVVATRWTIVERCRSISQDEMEWAENIRHEGVLASHGYCTVDLKDASGVLVDSEVVIL